MAKLGGSKQKKMNSRVDFTPMVDMIMLLVTFFMLCTTLVKPQTLEINMPSNKEDLKEDQQNKVKASEAITVLLDGEDKLYYYDGIPELGSVRETSYGGGENSLRNMLMRRNAVAVQKVKKLRQEKALNQTGNAQKEKRMEEEFRKNLTKIRNAKGVPNVIIKATDEANYANVIAVLDEMQICSIGKYVIDKINDFDKEMIEYYKKNGTNPNAPK